MYVSGKDKVNQWVEKETSASKQTNQFQDVDAVLTLIHAATQLNKTCRNKMTSVKGLNNQYIKKSQFAVHLSQLVISTFSLCQRFYSELIMTAKFCNLIPKAGSSFLSKIHKIFYSQNAKLQIPKLHMKRFMWIYSYFFSESS